MAQCRRPPLKRPGCFVVEPLIPCKKLSSFDHPFPMKQTQQRSCQAKLRDSHIQVYSNDHIQFHLVGGFNPSEKYEFVSWDYSSQLNGKIKAMFQTTNQISNFMVEPSRILREDFGWVQPEEPLSVLSPRRSPNVVQAFSDDSIL